MGEYPKNDKEARRVAEQNAMNERGGKQNLDNKRNEIDPKKWKEKGVKDVTPP